MSYTNAWSVTSPTGAVAANTIDEEIRKLRLDIQERLNSLVVSFAADPIVLQNSLLGGVTGKAVYISFANMNNGSYNATGYTSQSSGQSIYAPINIVPGCTLTGATVYINTSGSCTVSLESTAFSGTGSTTRTHTVVTSASDGDGDVTIGTSTLIAASTVYWLRITANAAFDVYGAKLLYNTPDSRYCR